MGITLAQVWQQELDTNKAALAAAKTDMGNAQVTLTGAKKQLDSNVSALKALTADIAANKGKLAGASVPSAVTALNNALRDQIIGQRSLQGLILDDQENVALAQAELDSATAAMNRAKTRVTASETSLAEAKKSGKKRDDLMKTAGSAPLDTLQADATAFASGSTASDADALVKSNLPDELQTVLVKRYATRRTRDVAMKQALTDAEKARATALAANTGLAGQVAEKEVAFLQAERRLRDYVATAKASFDRVVALFSEFQKIKNDPKLPDILTAQEKLDIAISTERTDAAKKVVDADDKLNAVIAAAKNLDSKILAQIDANVDTISTDPTVKAARNGIVNAEAALTASRAALDTSGEKKTMDEWEIVVQDLVWQSFVDYADGKEALAELKSVDPADLVTDLDAAEDAYALAIRKNAKAQRRVEALSDAIAMRSKRVETSASALSGRLLSAVRGDSY